MSFGCVIFEFDTLFILLISIVIKTLGIKLKTTLVFSSGIFSEHTEKETQNSLLC